MFKKTKLSCSFTTLTKKVREAIWFNPLLRQGHLEQIVQSASEYLQSLSGQSVLVLSP